MLITDIEHIDRAEWETLLSVSPVATWFQSPEAYRFFASMPDLMTPFVCAVLRETEQSRHRSITVVSPQYHRTIKNTPDSHLSRGEGQEERLVGLVVGYITKEKNPVRQFFTRRAVIYGGPLLAEDITEEELTELLTMVNSQLSNKSIFIETRNFNDYSPWRTTFEKAGFLYQPHLNFHVDTTSLELVNLNLGKNRKRDIRVSLRDGARIVENPALEQVRSYYSILLSLYQTKVRTPLFPWEFFERLYSLPSSCFLLVEYQGEIIGGTVCVVLSGKTVYEWFVCGEDGKYKNIFPSELATYAGLKFATENGCTCFDMMGAGTPEEHYGVRDFKARFGGQLIEHGRFLRVNRSILYNLGKFGVSVIRSRGGASSCKSRY
ncbi:MAG: GNAT family N-acetyltransferase [Paludibacteraceae bacterium]|nr:GNAT family N-acetyltransferase [Paludibacteraceae bacterium]